MNSSLFSCHYGGGAVVIQRHGPGIAVYFLVKANIHKLL